MGYKQGLEAVIAGGTQRAGSRATATKQRSFRVAARTLDLLDQRAGEMRESRNSLAQRLLDEGLRTDKHPLIYFREGAAGRRPALVGTRLDVWQVIETIRASGNSTEEAARHLDVPEPKVRAALGYYAEFADEIDAWAQEERDFARRELERWQREREVLG